MPEGAIVVFSAHGVAPVGARGGRRARPADHRRDLPAGDQGAPRGAAVRRRGLRHPADRPRGPRGGRRHHRRGARAHHARRRPRRRSPTVEVARPAKVAWLSQTTLSVDETDETVDALRERFPLLHRPAERRHLLRHAEPAGRGQGDRRRSPTWSSSSARANSSNSVRLVEVALEAGAAAAYLVDDAEEIDDGLARRA